MRRNSFRCFLLCAIATALAFSIHAQKSSQVGDLVSFCDLLDSSRDLEEKFVRTEAYMTYSTVGRVDGGDSFLYSPQCNSKDNFAIADLGKNLDKTSQVFFSKLTSGRNYRLKITVSGKLRTSFLPLYGHLSWSRYQFEIDSIASIEDDTRNAALPDFEAKSPSLEIAFRLRHINDSLIYYFFTGRSDEPVDDILDAKFVLIDLGGNTVIRDEVRSFSSNQFVELKKNIKTVGVRQPEVEINGVEYVATGIVAFEYGDGRKTQVEYVNTLRRANDSFIVLRTEFRPFIAR